jgi:hypothetical protein
MNGKYVAGLRPIEPFFLSDTSLRAQGNISASLGFLHKRLRLERGYKHPKVLKLATLYG